MTKSVFEKCLDGVKSVIDGLAISGITDTATQIKLSKQPWVRGILEATGILVSPRPEQSTPATNLSDDVAYGVLVSMAYPSNQAQDVGTSPILLWRQQIWDALSHHPESVTSELYDVRVEPAEVFWEPAFKEQWDVGALLVRCVERRRR